jgi:hypothetical protein
VLPRRRFNGSMSDPEMAFVEAFLRALVDDLVERPVPGQLCRVVIRWHQAAEPGHFTVHALGTEDDTDDIDPWDPLSWDNEDREFERTDRVQAQHSVTEAAASLAAAYHDLPDLVDGEWQAVAGTH